MRTLRFPRFGLAALLTAGALALACSSEDPPAPPPACTLGQLGDGCSGPAECCSGSCGNGICVAETCKALGVSCAAPSDCCSGACDGTSCVDPTQCGAVGESCTTPADCCTGECGGTIGALTCREPAGQCLPTGATCGTTNDCCAPLECDGTSKCAQPSGPICLDEGATCTSGWQCCSSTCNTLGRCADLSDICGDPGEPCATDSECCSQTCSGGLCGSNLCKQATQACTGDADCCSGICGFGNVCEPLPSGTTGQTCKTLGEACALATDCCSTNCRDGACKPAASCNAFGDVCMRPQDCCSGMCAQPAAGEPGRCDQASGGCGLDGTPCTSDSNCCTRKCVDLGTGAKVCQPSGGCRMTGNYCDSTASCCGGTNAANPALQNEYGVFCDGPGTTPGAPEWDDRTQDDRTCTGGQACNPPGNICGYKASQNCCYDGGGSGKAVCKPDAGGIMRCFGGPVNTTCPTGWDSADPDCCIQPGDVCQFRDQCCGFAPCVPDAQGVLRCGASDTCLPQGAVCSFGSAPSVDPCCTGTTCREISELGWVCATATGSCALQGQACNAGNPCCFGSCSGGVCATEACEPLGSACAADAECCAGTCHDGTCAACMAEAGSCTVTADCCSGLTCAIPSGATSGTCTGGGGGEPPPTCADTAASCLSLPCCNTSTDVCDGGVCVPAPTCSEQNELCTFGGSECCAPLTCQALGPFEDLVACDAGSPYCFCAPETEACIPMDDPCSTLVTCCAGYCQQTGSLASCTSTELGSCTCKPAG